MADCWSSLGHSLVRKMFPYEVPTGGGQIFTSCSTKNADRASHIRTIRTISLPRCVYYPNCHRWLRCLISSPKRASSGDHLRLVHHRHFSCAPSSPKNYSGCARCSPEKKGGRADAICQSHPNDLCLFHLPIVHSQTKDALTQKRQVLIWFGPSPLK